MRGGENWREKRNIKRAKDLVLVLWTSGPIEDVIRFSHSSVEKGSRLGYIIYIYTPIKTWPCDRIWSFKNDFQLGQAMYPTGWPLQQLYQTFSSPYFSQCISETSCWSSLTSFSITQQRIPFFFLSQCSRKFFICSLHLCRSFFVVNLLI